MTNDNIINKWEELLYGLFTHPELGFDTEFCAEYDKEDNIIENFGWIYPDENVMSYVSDVLKGWGISGYIDILREFEVEVSARVSTINNQTKKLQYLYALNYKFEEVFNRIELYQKIFEKVGHRASETLDNKDFDELNRISQFLRYLTGARNVINKAVEVNHKVLIELQEITGSSSQSNITKLKWLCNDTVAAFIITELISKGYIDKPRTNGEWSFSKTAKVCKNIFEFKTESDAHLMNAFNPERNKISKIGRVKLTLPDADQV